MWMQMMGIRKMWMRVLEWHVPVSMGVACTGHHGFIVLMVMVLVTFSVNVLVNMLKQLVGMFVLVPLREMQPYADRHQHARCQELRRDGFVQQRDGQRRAEEGRN